MNYLYLSSGGIPKVSAIKYKDGLNLGVGTSSGHVRYLSVSSETWVLYLTYLMPCHVANTPGECLLQKTSKVALYKRRNQESASYYYKMVC